MRYVYVTKYEDFNKPLFALLMVIENRSHVGRDRNTHISLGKQKEAQNRHDRTTSQLLKQRAPIVLFGTRLPLHEMQL